MAAPRDTDILVELLDRQFVLVLSEQGGRRLRLLPGLLQFIQREPALAGIVADLRLECSDAVQALTDADAQIRDRLLSLWDKHAAEIDDCLTSEAKGARFEVRASRATYRERVRERPPFAIPTTLVADAHEHPTKKLIAALMDWVVTVRQRAESAGGLPPAFEGVEGELERLAALHEHHLRRRDDIQQTMAGSAFDRLSALVEKLNPAPPVDDVDPAKSLVIWSAFTKQTEFAERVYGRRSRENFVAVDAVDAVAAAVSGAATVLHEELRARVLLGRSREALVRRYAARCEAFDAERLRDIAADTRRAERHLTREFAQYLFDQGLTPILDATIANLRPDVIDVAHGQLFYVEAKQYASASRNDVLGWFRQVWGTWARLRNQYDVPEAFVVIFRRDGAAPRLDLPRIVRHPHGFKMYPVFADLAERAGSSEGSPSLMFSEAELLLSHPAAGDALSVDTATST